MDFFWIVVTYAVKYTLIGLPAADYRKPTSEERRLMCFEEFFTVADNSHIIIM